VGGGARIVGGAIAQKIHASGGAQVRLDGDVTVVEGTRLTADIGATIHATSALLGDRFVKDVRLATHHVGGITSTQISTPERAIVSATGDAPDRDANHQRVGDAIAAHLGGCHLVVPEKLARTVSTLGVPTRFSETPATRDYSLGLRCARGPS
jgi:hypothetical protein